MWVLVAVQWAHMALGILWVGSAVALEVLVAPATDALPQPQRRAFGRRLGERVGPFFAAVGGGTMLLGVVRGTLLGPLRDVGALTSPYGLTWLAALLVTIGLAVLGGAAIGPAAARVYADDALWGPGPGGLDSPALAAALRHLSTLGKLQLAGFAIVLACMALMAVGQ